MSKTEGSPAVSRWLDAVSDGTRQGYLWHFNSFMNWIKVNSPQFADFSPDELVSYARNGKGEAMDDVLDLKKAYLLSLSGRVSHKRNADKTIKSFFSHNRVIIPKDTTLRIRGDKPKVKGNLEAAHIRDVIHSSNLMYKAVFSSMIMSGMGQDELIYWSKTGLEDLDLNLEDPSCNIVKIDLVGRKGEKFDYDYFTYVGPEAVGLLRRYLKTRPKRVEFAVKRTGKIPGALFLNQYGKALTKNALYRYWTRKLKRLGFIQPEKIEGDVKRYGLNPHEIRDTFRTLWRRSPSNVAFGEYFMGHSNAFDKYGYDKTYKDERVMREEYRKAVPYLSILSGTKPYHLVDEDEVERLRAEVEKYKTDLERQINLRLEDQRSFKEWQERYEDEQKLIKKALREKGLLP